MGLTTAEAERLTQRIELCLSTIADNTDAVVPMIEEARNGNAHEALGYRSWTAYVSEKFGGALARLGKAERFPFIELMTDQGMPKAAIAAIVGTTERTVQRDLNPADGRHDVSHDKPRVVTRRNGSDYTVPAGTKPKPPEPKKSRRRPLPDQYRTALWELDKAVTRIEKLQADDRFDPASDAYRFGHLTMLLKRLTATVEPHVDAHPEGST